LIDSMLCYYALTQCFMFFSVSVVPYLVEQLRTISFRNGETKSHLAHFQAELSDSRAALWPQMRSRMFHGVPLYSLYSGPSYLGI